MKTTGILLIGLSLGLTGFGEISTPAQTNNAATGAQAILKRPLPMTPALREIVKLTRAGVAEPVTLAFIRTSPTTFSLDAEDVIQLQQQGVSARITTALLQHGEELRRTSAESASPTSSPVLPTAPDTQATTTIDSMPSATPTGNAAAAATRTSTVSVTYFGARSYSCAPGAYSYATRYYPGYYWFGSGGHGYGAPRVAWSVGFGGVHPVGFYGGFGLCR